jgi:thiol-disulfide isomerase/thioredoxin
VKDDFPDLAVAPDADRAGLEQIVLKAKTARPRTVDQYQDQQMAIREASLRLLEIIPADDPAYGQTEIDSIIASVSLMAFFEDDEQQDIVESLKEYLSGREPLTMQDVQTGVLAAGMIELQPDKKPAIELYEFLDRCLENDSREEMQSLRLNLQASLRRLNLLGSRFELEAVTIDGKKITADDLKGKYVIVDFFATWCAPCLAEAELIAFHYKKYADKGLAVIGISLDEGKQELQDYMDRKRLPWPIVHDADEDPLKRLAMKFGISALPTVLLLDKEGTVVSLEARQSELNRLMQILFEAPTPASELDQADQPADQPADQQPEIESRLEGIKK